MSNAVRVTTADGHRYYARLPLTSPTAPDGTVEHVDSIPAADLSVGDQFYPTELSRTAHTLVDGPTPVRPLTADDADLADGAVLLWVGSNEDPQPVVVHARRHVHVATGTTARP